MRLTVSTNLALADAGCCSRVIHWISLRMAASARARVICAVAAVSGCSDVVILRYAKDAKLKYEQEKNKARENDRQLALVQRQVQRQDDELSAHLSDFSSLRLQIARVSKQLEALVFTSV